ncbi:LacI family DNA-binding transcriptional regulator [Streptomyces sp. NPDC047981]|uniref:LacI family DNA-binding transcriptional regulator n=1 Tax=Streptomyces sp. NPDC047981 TaxID=3154610 RepID=UPI0034314BDF
MAERAGVSPATVSRILNGNYPAAPATRERVARAVDELQYVANPHARALAGPDPGTIGIVVSTIDDGAYGAMVQRIASLAAVEGRLCLITTTGGDAAQEEVAVRRMRSQGVQAIVMVGGTDGTDPHDKRTAALYRTVESSGIRMVHCARGAIDATTPAAVVEYDNTGGAYAATSHLVSLGHRRIVYLSRGGEHSTIVPRRAGYRRALAELGGEADPALELVTATGSLPGYTEMRRFIRSSATPFTAVFAYNDRIAAGAVQALREAGLRVPEDVSVVGYDDTHVAQGLGLASVHLPAEELGYVAAGLALSSAPPFHSVISTRLIVRGSVAPPAAGR